MDNMILWTIQHEDVFAKACARGFLKTDGRYVYPPVRDAYRWMADQMVARGITEKRVYPVWAWYEYNGKRKQPDLRRSYHLPRGTSGVCIEFVADDSRVLLSQLGMWTAVINKEYAKAYLDENMEQCIEPVRSFYEIRESWQRVFDLGLNCEPWYPERTKWIQACVPVIYHEQIRRVTKFVAR